jgi:hypothetical protein
MAPDNRSAPGPLEGLQANQNWQNQNWQQLNLIQMIRKLDPQDSVR